ncbi:MAG: hypothetical protein WC384_11650 [Prolixibacteraceae bacterium]|jgi:hypothetical protein
MPWIGKRNAVAFYPGFIPKSGKHTPGIGYSTVFTKPALERLAGINQK